MQHERDHKQTDGRRAGHLPDAECGGDDHRGAALRGVHAPQTEGERAAAAGRVSGGGSVRGLWVQADFRGKAHPTAGCDPAALPDGAVSAGGGAGGAAPLWDGTAVVAIPAGHGAAGGFRKRSVRPGESQCTSPSARTAAPAEGV